MCGLLQTRPMEIGPIQLALIHLTPDLAVHVAGQAHQVRPHKVACAGPYAAGSTIAQVMPGQRDVPGFKAQPLHA